MNLIVAKALKIATLAHEGQFRKWSGEPYIVHPKRVAEKFRCPTLKAAALLHDVIEDTPWTGQMLFDEGIPMEVIIIVEHLTRRSDVETHKEYIERVANCHCYGAIEIKIEDILDNFNGNKEPSMIKRYEWSYERLTGEMLEKKISD